MRVIFFGTAEFAVPVLERLIAHHHDIVACVTQPDRPQGRGLALAPSPVKQAALRLGLPLSQPARPDHTAYEAMKPDVGVAAAYGELIRQQLLDLPTHGMLGVHPSLLPKYRGAAPVAWALLNGETTTGVTIFKMVKQMDAGEIALQRTVAVQPREDTHALTGRLAQEGAGALVETLDALAANRATFTAQDESAASLAPKLTKAQGRVDWSTPAVQIERLVRATNPWPGASTSWHGTSLKIWDAAVSDPSAAHRTAGAVVDIEEGTIAVATGKGTLELREVQPAGKRRMGVREFLAGHRVSVGELLGGQGPGAGGRDDA